MWSTTVTVFSVKLSNSLLISKTHQNSSTIPSDNKISSKLDECIVHFRFAHSILSLNDPLINVILLLLHELGWCSFSSWWWKIIQDKTPIFFFDICHLFRKFDFQFRNLSLIDILIIHVKLKQISPSMFCTLHGMWTILLGAVEWIGFQNKWTPCRTNMSHWMQSSNSIFESNGLSMKL